MNRPRRRPCTRQTYRNISGGRRRLTVGRLDDARAVCSMSPPRRPTIRSMSPRPGRCARAAAAPWWSSRSSNVAFSPGRHPGLHRYPGYRRRDPARPDADTIQRRPEPGSGRARAGATHKQTSLYQNRHVRFSASAFAI